MNRQRYEVAGSPGAASGQKRKFATGSFRVHRGKVLKPIAERMFAYGACTCCPEKDEMADLLSRHGLAVSKGTFTIRATDCEVFTFEDWTPDGEWTLDGTAARPEVLAKDARLVSRALTNAGIRHWLGIFDGKQNQVDYMHFDWPDDQANQAS